MSRIPSSGKAMAEAPDSARPLLLRGATNETRGVHVAGKHYGLVGGCWAFDTGTPEDIIGMTGGGDPRTHINGEEVRTDVQYLRLP